MNHRRAHAHISLVLAVAIAALAGCNASPTSKTEVIAPLPFGQEAPAEGQQEAHLGGEVTLNGQPLANAQLRVLDAMSGEPVMVIAPSGGNVVASGGANLTTNDIGRFHVDLVGIAPGQVVRVVATANGQTVSTLVSGDGMTIDPGRTVQALYVNAPINEASTMLSLMADGALRMSQMVKPKAASAIIADLFKQMQVQIPLLNTSIGYNMLASSGVLNGMNPETGELSADGAAKLNTMLASTGNLQTWLDLNRSTIEQILVAVKTRANLNPALFQRLGKMQNVPLPGTGVVISLDERYLTIVGADGKTVKLDLTDYAQLEAAAQSAEFRQAFQAASAAVMGQGAKK
jgi:hypothetical protein